MPNDEEDGLDPELEDALASVDNGDEPYFDDAAEPSEEVAAAAAEVRAEVENEKPKRGRPRTRQAKHVAGSPIVPPPASLSSGKAPPTRNLQEVWNDIVDRVRDRNLGGPESVTIGVMRHSIGPNREDPVSLNSIPGQTVAGTASLSPGEDLEDYLTRAYHVASNSGPALYKLRFTLRGAAKNDRHLGAAEILLQSSADIRRMWEASAQVQRERERDRDFGPVGGRYVPQGGRILDRGERGVSPYEVPSAAEHPTVAPTAPVPPSNDATLMFLKYLMDQNAAERREAIRVGQQPPVMQLPPEIARLVGGAPQAATAAPQVSLEERVARTVVETLKAMGITPQAPQTAVQQAVAGVLPAAAVTPMPSPGVAEVQKKVGDPLEGMERMFDFMERMDKMRDKFKERFVPEEEEVTPAVTTPTVLVPAEEDENALKPVNETFVRFEGDPVMFGKQAEGESNFQWLMRLGTGNPKIVGKVLEKGMQVLDSGTLGKLIAALAPPGQPGAAPRGLPNGASAPQAQPQSNGTAGGWTPNVG